MNFKGNLKSYLPTGNYKKYGRSQSIHLSLILRVIIFFFFSYTFRKNSYPGGYKTPLPSKKVQKT